MTNQIVKQPAEMNRKEFAAYVARSSAYGQHGDRCDYNCSPPVVRDSAGLLVGVIRTNNTIFFKFKDARNLGEFHAKVGFLDFCKRQNITYEDIKPFELGKA